jgi:hypothetical protein
MSKRDLDVEKEEVTVIDLLASMVNQINSTDEACLRHNCG